MGSRWIHSIHTTNHVLGKPKLAGRCQTYYQKSTKVVNTFSKSGRHFFLGGKHFFLHRSIDQALPYFGHRKAIMAKLWQNRDEHNLATIGKIVTVLFLGNTVTFPLCSS
jgi:hypothetical protein